MQVVGMCAWRCKIGEDRRASQDVVVKEYCIPTVVIVLGTLLLGLYAVQVFVVIHGAPYSPGVLSRMRCMALE